MIDQLSETYRELAARAMGLPARQVSVLMVHRPHEDKDYADQSVYFFFNKGDRTPSAVGKVGFDPAGIHYLEREHLGLQSLSEREPSLPRKSVPRPLLYGEVAGRQVLLQSAIPGEKVSTWLGPGARLNARLGRFLTWAGDWSAALGQTTRCDAGDLVLSWTEEFCVRIDPTGRSRALMEGAVARVRDSSEGTLPGVLAHGDFCGENILEEGKHYGVIDWELCDRPSVPAYDLLDLCLWVVSRTEGHVEADPFAALERLLRGADPLARALRRMVGRYAGTMGIPREALPSLVTLAWAGYCLKKLRHLEHDESGHFARARVGARKILLTPGEVLAGDRNAR